MASVYGASLSASPGYALGEYQDSQPVFRRAVRVFGPAFDAPRWFLDVG